MEYIRSDAAYYDDTLTAVVLILVRIKMTMATRPNDSGTASGHANGTCTESSECSKISLVALVALLVFFPIQPNPNCFSNVCFLCIGLEIEDPSDGKLEELHYSILVVVVVLLLVYKH